MAMFPALMAVPVSPVVPVIGRRGACRGTRDQKTKRSYDNGFSQQMTNQVLHFYLHFAPPH
jgi:hypothetical protein